MYSFADGCDIRIAQALVAKQLQYLPMPSRFAISGPDLSAKPLTIPAQGRKLFRAHRSVHTVRTVRVFNPQRHHIRCTVVWGMPEQRFCAPKPTEAVDQRAVVGLTLPHAALQRQQAMQCDGDGGWVLTCSAHVAVLHRGVGVADRSGGWGGRVAW